MESNLVNNPQPPIEVQPVQKQSSFLITLLSILLLIAVFIAGFFAYQTQNLVKELTKLQVTSTPLDTSESALDPTANWKTYTNKKYGYSFKHPQPNEYSLKNDVFTDDLVEMKGLDSLIIKIEPIKTTEYNPEVWWSWQTTDPFFTTPFNRPIDCYEKTITKSIPSRYKEILDNPTDPVINFDKNVVLLRQTDEKICNEPPYIQIILLPTKNGILSIQEGYSSIGELILSTFKFIEPTATSSPTPVACTMEAKICPDGSSVGRTGPKCEFSPCPTPK